MRIHQKGVFRSRRVPMGWPLVFVLFVGACALVVIATQHFSSRRLKKQAVTRGDVIQWCFLLQAFHDMRWKLPLIYKDEEWKPFYDKMKGVLGGVRTAASYSQGGMEDDIILMQRLSEAIDIELVSYLRSQTELNDLLHECLPDSGQSWASIPTRARENLDSESDSSEYKFNLLFKDEMSGQKLTEALEDMRMSVDLILRDLDECNSSVSVGATRGKTDLTSNQGPPDYITVFYATDRQMTEDGEYSGIRSKGDKLHYGRMTVGIPSCGKGLKIPHPQKHEEVDPHLHIVIFSMNTELGDNEGGFLKKLNKALHSKAEGNEECMKNGLLLYIHGFNVSHKKAIKRAARLKRDINFKGQAIVYSWSSSGVLGLRAYSDDANCIENTVNCLKGFIQTITNEIPGNPDVHIIAHSMGNRGLIEALKQMAHIPSTMKNVVFAAADVQRESFDDMVCKVQTGDSQSDHQQHSEGEKLSVRTLPFTVYSSKHDVAMCAAKLINWSKGRLGDTRSFLDTTTQEKGSDQVDVTGPKVGSAWLHGLHHSYYGKIPEVLEDIEDLVTLEWNAEQRCERKSRIKSVTYEGKKFFAFDESVWPSKQRCL